MWAVGWVAVAATAWMSGAVDFLFLYFGLFGLLLGVDRRPQINKISPNLTTVIIFLIFFVYLLVVLVFGIFGYKTFYLFVDVVLRLFYKMKLNYNFLIKRIIRY